DGSAGFAERWWAVRVEPPRPPRVEVASPVDPALEVAPDQAVELVLRTRPSADGETVRTSWTVDGVLAGEGERLELTPSRLGRIRVRALATGSLGSATAREWEIEVLLQRYAAAWRKHDVDELRRIGQITSEAQAAALRDYFARVDDLDVEVQLLEVRPRGDHRTVRFTRRDRFRDPLGRLISQET